MAGQFAPGTGHNWTQSTSGSKPTYKASILNGLGIARFDGTDDFLANVDPSALTAVHCFLVVKIDADPPPSNLKAGLWSNSGAAATVYADVSDNNIYDGAFSSARRVFNHTGQALNTWRVVEVVSTASEWTFKLDGTQLHTTGTNTVNITSTPSWFALGQDGPFDGIFLDGDVAGMYIFSAKLTSTRADMISYLNTRFGLSSS